MITFKKFTFLTTSFQKISIDYILKYRYLNRHSTPFVLFFVYMLILPLNKASAQSFSLIEEKDTTKFYVADRYGYQFVVRNDSVHIKHISFSNSFFDIKEKIVLTQNNILSTKKYLNNKRLDSIIISHNTKNGKPISKITCDYDKRGREVLRKEYMWMNNSWIFSSANTYKYTRNKKKNIKNNTYEYIYFDKIKKKIYDKTKYRIEKKCTIIGNLKDSIDNFEDVLTVVKKKIKELMENKIKEYCFREDHIFYLHNKKIMIKIRLNTVRVENSFAIIVTNGFIPLMPFQMIE